MTQLRVLAPAWPAPSRVKGLFTTRAGGISTGPWGGADQRGGLNLGVNCGDEPQRVSHNRELVVRSIGMPVHWLEQVHGARAVEVTEAAGLGKDHGDAPVKADGQVSRIPGIAIGVLVADCLPVLLADRAGSVVGVAHAGWRGLAAGVLENTIALMRKTSPGADLIAWLGPCIGPTAFEVGDDVLDAFASQDGKAAVHFRRREQRPGKWWADLPGLAMQRLQEEGVNAVFRSNACTVSDSERFWSYRRDGRCGRMAGIIGLQDS